MEQRSEIPGWKDFRDFSPLSLFNSIDYHNCKRRPYPHSFSNQAVPKHRLDWRQSTLKTRKNALTPSHVPLAVLPHSERCRRQDVQTQSISNGNQVTQRFHLANWVSFSALFSSPFLFFSCRRSTLKSRLTNFFSHPVFSLSVSRIRRQSDNGGIAMYNSLASAKQKGLVKVDKSGAVQLRTSTQQYQNLRDSVRLVSKQT